MTEASQAAVMFDMQTGDKIVVDKIDPAEPGVITNFAWSPDSTILTYYRGGDPEFRKTIPQLRQIKRLADGSWSKPRTIALDPSGKVMLPVRSLGDGRMLTQMAGAGYGFGPVSYITDLTSGTTQPLSRAGSDQTPDVSDVTPESRIVFGTWRTSGDVPPDPNIYTGQIAAGGAITDIVTLAPPQEESFVSYGKFTPDRTGVLAVTMHGPQGGPFEYGLFSLLDNGATRYTSLLSPQPSIMGQSPLGSKYAVVSVTDESWMKGEIWLLALDGSLAAPLTEGFWPVGLPVCEK